MSEKDDELRKEIQRQIDEAIRREKREEQNRRDITKVQAPEKWPDPPKEDNDK